MIATCPGCGRKAAVGEGVREVVCDCGRRYEPGSRPTVADPFLGREVAGYRVEEVIGSGGMGTVYRATQLSLGRAVAFKVLPQHVTEDPHFVRRFHREAQVLASLSHANVVSVIDRGEFEGRFFIVMEFVEGENLRDLMRRGRVPAKQACRIVAGLLAALDYAHERGIVHRDIKPENVLVSTDGVVKVADFGLSRVLGGDDLDSRLTHTHLVLGTYEYMAPEQREASREADSRADIYATAVVFYEMLTGELPIGRFELPSSRVPGLDRRIDQIVERGLAKDPDDRYARAGGMGDAIEKLLSAPEEPVDLEALRRAAGRFADRVQAGVRNVHTIFRRSREAPRPPTSFELHLDLLFTILAVCGVLLLVSGIALLIAEEQFAIGLLDLGRDYAGVLVAVYGALLWNAAERARKYWPGARTMLLTLTLIAAPTIVALPIVIWTWFVLLGPRMRVFMDARFRGMDAAEAAAAAQGIPLPPRERPEVAERCRLATKTNRKLALATAILALAAWVAWFIVALDAGGKAFRDEGIFFFSAAWLLTLVEIWCAILYVNVARSRLLLANAVTWTLLSPLAPKAAQRAWMLVRDDRETRKGL